MANLTGVYMTGELKGFPPDQTPDIDGHSATFGNAASASDLSRGSLSGSGVVSVVSGAMTGDVSQMFGQLLFEKIIVLPRIKAAGFVLSTQVFPVEVWNTHTRESKVLSSLVISGVGGLQISGGLDAGSTFGPFRSSVYAGSLSGDGDATITNVATFVFPGESGTEMTVTGSRLSVFSVEIDWSEGFDETLEFRTNIITAFSGKEQRIRLRTVPRFSASFNVTTVTPREQAALDALIAGWHARVYGVPWWVDESPLLSPVTPGALSLQVDVTDRPAFAADGLVMLWRDQFTWEALQVQSVGSGIVNLVSAVTQSWEAGALVVPLKRGRLADMVNITRHSLDVSTLKPTFDCEVV